MQAGSVGWDIGGAHIKAVLLNPERAVVKVVQKPCLLWQGIERLQPVLQQILRELPKQQYVHALTMTGELVDGFDNKAQGVAQIIATAQACLEADQLLIYAGLDGLLKAQEVQQRHYQNIASANWLASASLAAKRLQDGLFVDLGSTTTDLLVVADYKVQAIGMTDYARLVSAELVYTGIVRTAVMAVTQRVCFQGKSTGLMAEYFATMADVYRLTGELNEQHDQAATADGAQKTLIASAKRLSRMIGCDFAEHELARWQQLAVAIKAQQKQQIVSACKRQLARGLLPPNAAIIGAGIGRFLVRQIAQELAHPYLDFADLFVSQCQQTAMNVADCAPAAAVAHFALSIDQH